MDVLSFQHFAQPEAVSQNLADWHQKTGKPVLLADHAISTRLSDGSLRHDGRGYAETPDTEALTAITAANAKADRWMRAAVSP